MKHASADAPSTLVLHVETDQVAKAFREEPKLAGPSPRLPLPAPRSAASFVPGRRYRSGRRAPLVPEDGQSRNESFSAQIVSLRACSNRSPWSMANLIPESFQSIELLVWLGVGIIGAALAGLVAGVIRKAPTERRPGDDRGFGHRRDHSARFQSRRRQVVGSAGSDGIR